MKKIIALNILTKQAAFNPAYIPKITNAFCKNMLIRPEIMESFSILGIHDQVRDFLLKCINEGESGQLSSDVIETEEEKISDNDKITILGIQ